MKRFGCDECAFSAANWESWDRHVREHHEPPPTHDEPLPTHDDWADGPAVLVIDEQERFTGSGFAEPQPHKIRPASTSGCQKMLPTSASGSAAYPSRAASQDAESSLERGSGSLKTEPSDGSFPPGMEPELISVNPAAAGEVPQLMKIGSGRKGVKLRCRLCPFECYRTPNFRRHLAIHVHQAEYPESYRCAYCKFQHRRLNCIRFHLGKYHGQLPAKLSRVVRGKVVEVISADDVTLPPAKYGRTALAPDDIVMSHRSVVGVQDYTTGKQEEMVAAAACSREIRRVDDQSQSGGGSAQSRERRACKPPKRLSDTSDFQPPSAVGVSSWKLRKVLSAGAESGSPGALAQARTAPSNRPFDDNIAEDYIQSDLPPGMIYPQPVKCPRCAFTNRVRINLVRHMKQHHTEDQQRLRTLTTPASSSQPPVWLLDGVPAWARPAQSADQTTPVVPSDLTNTPTDTPSGSRQE